MNNTKHTLKANIETSIDKDMAQIMFRNVDRHTWRVERYEPHVAMFLLLHNIPFRYEPNEQGANELTFVAPSIYVKNLLIELRDKNGLYEPQITNLQTIIKGKGK